MNESHHSLSPQPLPPYSTWVGVRWRVLKTTDISVLPSEILISLVRDSLASGVSKGPRYGSLQPRSRTAAPSVVHAPSLSSERLSEKQVLDPALELLQQNLHLPRYPGIHTLESLRTLPWVPMNTPCPHSTPASYSYIPFCYVPKYTHVCDKGLNLENRASLP